MAMGLGIGEIFWAECLAIIMAVEKAIEKGWWRLRIETNSQLAMVTFKENRVPWQLRERMSICRKRLHSIRITHIWCEGNIAADMAAGVGKCYSRTKSSTHILGLIG